MKNKKGTNRTGKKAATNRNRWLASVGLAALAIGGIAAAAGTMAQSAQTGQRAQAPQNARAALDAQPDYSNVRVRTNPINGFEGVDVYDDKNEPTGKRMVLTTIDFNTRNPKSGVALVDADQLVLDSWVIPDTVGNNLNYTTNIIAGPDANTFFVLAGINNLAKALNTVYTDYDPTHTNYADVVTANLSVAPSIKIFKIVLNGATIGNDPTNPVYDFKYPSFSDQPTYNGGLKFFTKSGLFASNLAQQTGWGSNQTFNSFGYLQYLFYGQLFQYNYSKNSGDEDEFAMISSYLGTDASLGNLYGYYNQPLGAQTPALSYVEYFFAEVLRPMIKDPINTYTTTPYVPVDGAIRTDYAVADMVGGFFKAPADDQLTVAAALSIAFMLDYQPWGLPASNDNISTLKGTMTRIGHGALNVVPGWFLFKPDRGPNWMSYGYAFVNANYPIGNSIWMTAIGSYYNRNEQKYYTVHARLTWSYNMFFDAYTVHDYDYFSIDPAEYNSAGIKIGYGSNVVSFSGLAFTRVWSKNPFIKMLDFATNSFAFSTNTNQIGLFSRNEGQTVLTENQYVLTGTVLKFAYDLNSEILSVFTNRDIYAFVFDPNNLPADESPWAADVYSRTMLTQLGFVYNVPVSNLVDKNMVLNPNNQGRLNGYVVNMDTNVGLQQIYSIQSATTAGKTKILGAFSMLEFGYQATRDDVEFDSGQKSQPIASIAGSYTSDELKSLFVNKPRRKGTFPDAPQIGLIVTRAAGATITVNELIRHQNMVVLGFAIKSEDLESLDTYFEAATYQSSYTGVFQPFVPSVVSYIEPGMVAKDQVLRGATVNDLVNEYQNDYAGFQKKYFDRFVQRIDNRSDGNAYELKIVSYSVPANAISFLTVEILPQGQLIASAANPESPDGTTFAYNNVFPLSVGNDAVMYIIIAVSVAVALILLLGLAIGIPMRRNRKAIERQFIASHNQINTLTLAVGSVFKKLAGKFDEQQAAMIGGKKQAKPKPKDVRFAQKPPEKPTYKAPPPAPANPPERGKTPARDGDAGTARQGKK